MVMLIADDFLKDIPASKREFIIGKLESFSRNIKNSRFLFDMPAGFWIRKVAGTGIFKFRVNNGDRVLFTVIRDRGEETIEFLRYCNHDEQIRTAKSLGNVRMVDFEPNVDEYVEDETDEYLNSRYSQYFSEHASVDLSGLPAIVLEDEYIALLLDENNEDYLYYLNNEQFQCLEVLNRPVFVCGSAGSGKTMIAIHKLLLNHEAGIRTLYITGSALLKENSERCFKKYKTGENSSVDFYTVNGFCLEKLHLHEAHLVRFPDFENWYQKSVSLRKSKKYTAFNIWSEISGIIKGYKGEEWNTRAGKMISEEEYCALKYSSVDREERKSLYAIAEQYDKWLKDDCFHDENGIARLCLDKLAEIFPEPYDFVVIDEVQDMNEAQLILLCSLAADKSNILMTGDVNQIINPSFFNIGRLKKYFYSNHRDVEEKKISKNYRSVSGIVELANKLCEIRSDYIGKSSYDISESFIREGGKPLFINFSDSDFKRLYDEMSKRDYCAIVVSDSEERDRLKSEGFDTGRVFTVNEIKGLEYRNILCCNLISRYRREWDAILSGEAKNNSYYRLFVNLLYVASTRARDMLCFTEAQNDSPLLQELSPFYARSQRFDPVELHQNNKIRTFFRLEKGSDLFFICINARHNSNTGRRLNWACPPCCFLKAFLLYYSK